MRNHIYCRWTCKRTDLNAAVSSVKVLKIERYVPESSKGVKFQPPGLFLVVKGLKFQTIGGFRHIFLDSLT